MTVIFSFDFKRTLHLNPINNNMCCVQFPDAYLNYVTGSSSFHLCKIK